MNPVKLLNHEEATEAYNRGEVIKISSTIMIFTKQNIKMKDSSYVVDSRMPQIRHSFYELVSKDEYEVLP